MLEKVYHAHFFQDQAVSSLQSARAVVPLVQEMFRPQRVVDVGCGVGGWLTTFREIGVEDVLGIDGDYVNRSQLLIPSDRFVAHNLEEPLPDLGRFDLAMSLEVAEHLPAYCAPGFVASLTRLAPVVLFSAAVPLQGGENHLNEQWPEYWESLFRERGYQMVDLLRRRIWQDERIDWWYRQNLILFVNEPVLSQHPEFSPSRIDGKDDRLMLINRRILQAHLDQALSLRHVLRALPAAILRSLRLRLLGSTAVEKGRGGENARNSVNPVEGA
jgi:SAM-dependent methyltransferase